MMDELDEDALFDRLAKNLHAVREDAELVRSRGAEGLSAGLARAETEVRTLAAAVEALCQRVEQQQVVTARLEAAALKTEAEVQELNKTIEALSHRLQKQPEVIADTLARRSWPRAAALIGVVLVVVVLGGGAAVWTAAGREPSIGALAHRVVVRLSALSGIGRAGPGEPVPSDRTVAQAAGNPEPMPQPQAVPAPAAPVPEAPAAVVAPAGTKGVASPPSVAPPSTAETVAGPLPPPAEKPVALAPAPVRTAALAPVSAETPAAVASPPVQTAVVAAPSSSRASAIVAPLPSDTVTAAAPPPAETQAAAVSPPAQPVVSVTSPHAQTATATTPLPTEAAAAAGSPSTTTTTTAAAVSSSPVTGAPVAASSHDQAEPKAPAATALAPSSQVPNVVHHIVLRAAAETWVSVRQSGGRTLLTKTMNAGETWPVPSEPNLLLDTGNANALVLEVDGVPARLTGAKGIVIHNVPLDADLLGSGMAVRLGH